MGKIRGELEDLAFRYLEPEASAELLQANSKPRAPANEAFLERDPAYRRGQLWRAKAFRRASKAA